MSCAAARAWAERGGSQRLCSGGSGLRLEAEAAYTGAGAGVGRYERREWRAAAVYADGTGEGPRRHGRSAKNREPDGVEISEQPVAGGGAVFEWEHVHAEARLSDGGGVLRIPGITFSGEQECSRGALASWMAELPAGTLSGSRATENGGKSWAE